MKSVLISIRPKWCEKICHEIGKDENGKPIYEKVIEVRKSKPSEVPFRVLIYCTKGGSTNVLLKDKNNRFVFGDYRNACTCDADGNVEFENVQGKVIGEFICDYVYKWKYDYCDGVDIDDDLIVDTCLDREDINIYAKGKPLYGWHISDLKIYDKPKYLNEITPFCKCERARCESCIHYVEAFGGCCRVLKRPPQSWCYVEGDK